MCVNAGVTAKECGHVSITSSQRKMIKSSSREKSEKEQTSEDADASNKWSRVML